MKRIFIPLLALAALSFAACEHTTPAETAQHDQAREATPDTAVVFRPADYAASRARLADLKLTEIKNPGIAVRGDSSYAVYSLDEAVLFDTDKAAIKPDAAATLDEIVASIGQRYQGKAVEVAGFADSRGDAKYNMQLGQERANAVKTYLVGKGMAASRVSTESFGEEQPVASNATPAGRQENRRVEIAVQLR